MNGSSAYWIARLVFEKGVALTYLIAFVGVMNQFLPLLGERGLLRVPDFVRRVSFRDAPSLCLFFPKDRAFRACGWAGVALSCVALSGLADRYFWTSALVWAALWVLYLSFVNVGQTWYAFGWESILLRRCTRRGSPTAWSSTWWPRWCCGSASIPSATCSRVSRS